MTVLFALLDVQPPAVESEPVLIVPQEMSPDAFVWSACEPVHDALFESVNVLEIRPVPVTSNVLPGAFVPIPTLPPWSTKSELATASPPEKVEVAVVEVAKYEPAVGVELDTATPDALSVRIIFFPCVGSESEVIAALRAKRLVVLAVVANSVVEVALVVVALPVTTKSFGKTYEPEPKLPPVVVMTPVEELYEIAFVPESEVEDILFWKMLQSAEVSLPCVVADAEGKLNVIVAPEPVMVKSEPEVEVAKLTGPKVTCWFAGPTAVMVPPPAAKHVPLSEKQPVAILIPFAAVVVAPVRVSAPVIVVDALIVEEAFAIKPPVSEARPVTPNVEAKVAAPEAVKAPLTVDDALEINPPVRVESPDTASVPVAVKFVPVTFCGNVYEPAPKVPP